MAGRFLRHVLGPLNVFRYITFRTGGATVTALFFVFLFGPGIIDRLRLKQGKGQPIRTDGPQSHLVTKKGTPTMGGLMILSGMRGLDAAVGQSDATPMSGSCSASRSASALIGFYDDYLKVTKQTPCRLFRPHRGLRSRSADRGRRLSSR